MGAKLPNNAERKKGFSVSIEPSWKDRFMLACYNKGVLASENIVAGQLCREFIIKKTIEFEEYVQKKRGQQGGKP